MEVCGRCGKNEVPNKKYLCLSCICASPDCRDAVHNGKFCANHSCRICVDEEGEEYITVSGRCHNAPSYLKPEKFQFYIDFDLCSAYSGNGIQYCGYHIHSDICNKYSNRYPSDRGDYKGYSGCKPLNMCTVKTCDMTITNYELMRCQKHYFRCHICYINFVNENNRYSNICISCSNRNLIKCNGCNGIFAPHFHGGGMRCLFDYMVKFKDTNEILYRVIDGIIVNIDETTAKILKYYYVLYTSLRRTPPAEYSHLFALPKDLFYLIMNHVITLPSIMTPQQYFSNPISCSEIIIRK